MILPNEPSNKHLLHPKLQAVNGNKGNDATVKILETSWRKSTLSNIIIIKNIDYVVLKPWEKLE